MKMPNLLFLLLYKIMYTGTVWSNFHTNVIYYIKKTNEQRILLSSCLKMYKKENSEYPISNKTLFPSVEKTGV